MSILSRLLRLARRCHIGGGSSQAYFCQLDSGTTGYTGVFSGAGSVTNTFNQLQSCPGGGLGGCGSTDVVSTPQSYTASSNITASSSTSAVWASTFPRTSLASGSATGRPATTTRFSTATN